MPELVAQIVNNSGNMRLDGRLESTGALSAILASYTPGNWARFRLLFSW